MNDETRALISYRLERAREALEEAGILFEKGYANTFVNRLYYACFYAVSALLLTKGLSSAKHSGVRAAFHQNFVKPGVIGKEVGQLYDRLFDNRQKGDYADFVKFDLKEVAGWRGEASALVESLSEIILREMEKGE